MLDFLVLGAGPAGLSFANELKKSGNDNFIVLETESEAGGLCRSVDVDGSPLDIGGGHFLDVRRPKVDEFLFQFMPKEEWNLFERNSKISVFNQMIDHPFEANIWQLDIDNQIGFLESISKAGCNVGIEKPEKFVDWIAWKLGDRIADAYMLPYNKKMFGDELNQLGTYWLEKLPNVSFEDTLRSCLLRRAYAEQPGHASFYYPKKYGYGEVWKRMATELGDRIEYNKKVVSLDITNRSVATKDGLSYQAEKIITTIPWTSFLDIEGMPSDIKESIRELKHCSVEIKYHPEKLDTDSHWIYYPDLNLSYHRILVRSNFLEGSKGYWTETNKTRIENNEDSFAYMNEYAYPLNTINKPDIIDKLLRYCKEHDVYGLGRWGEHQHYNSDLTVELAVNLADELICK